MDENSWWFKWKTRQIKNLEKQDDFIQIKNGNELIDLLKEHNLYNQYFKIEDSQKIDAIYNVIVPQKTENIINSNPKNILFNNYSEKCEEYYYERDIDKSFQNNLKLNNIWVFGKSGRGKTAYLNRNILVNKLNFCYCDLSPISIISADNILEEIVLNIEAKFEIAREKEETNLIKQIVDMLISKCDNEIVIVIDELSISSGEILKEIVQRLTQLVIHFNNKTPDGNLRFIVSTINTPQSFTNNFSKLSEYFQVIACDNWEGDLPKLFDLINGGLNLPLIEYKKEIVESAKNSPRSLKSIFRKLLLLEEINQENISQTIKIVDSETVNNG